MSESVLLLLKGWRARWDLNPGPPAPQAGVIIRTRRRAQRLFMPRNLKGRIVNTLLKLKNSGLGSNCYLGKVDLNWVL
jgi:hypothetical protein